MLLFLSFVIIANTIMLVATIISYIKTVKITNATAKTCEEINQRLARLKKLHAQEVLCQYR